VQAWNDRDDIGPLRAWVDAHATAASSRGRADDVQVWREVVALAEYDACHADDAVDEARMREVVRRWPDTVAGRSAVVRLTGDVLGRLRAAIPSRDLVDFLEGGDAWARATDGQSRLPATDLVAFRDAHAPALAASLGQTLLADRCRTHMAYCNWWIERRADDARTPAIAAARKQAWYERAHPTWRGGPHARCAARCAKTCRERATPLDDGCWSPCYARCP
jgi:hypothetical protein